MQGHLDWISVEPVNLHWRLSMAFQREILRRANTILPSTLLARPCWLKGMPPASVLATTFFENLTHAKLPAADERLTSIGLVRQQA
jgi:hypothetical protein